MAMAIKIGSAVGPVRGMYEKKGDVPITTRPCEHLVLFKDKSIVRGGGIRIVSFQGDGDGEARITSREA